MCLNGLLLFFNKLSCASDYTSHNPVNYWEINNAQNVKIHNSAKNIYNTKPKIANMVFSSAFQSKPFTAF